jgi:ParB family chromosome partitioning protein
MKRVLGKGLDALIPGASETENERAELSGLSVIREIPLAKIKTSPFQPRLKFDDGSLDELARSIESKGVIQPIVVRPIDDSYELVVGERRLRATERLGRATIPAVIHDTISNEEAMELTLVENIQREDLNPIEEARAYYRLMTECNLKQEDLAAKVGKSRPAVANAIRLLSLPEAIQEMIFAGSLSAGHARTLLAVPRDDEKIALAKKVISGVISVRDLERAVYADKNEKRAMRAALRESEKLRPVEIIAIEDKLTHFMGTKVMVAHRRKKGGKIIIEYYSNDEFSRLLELFGIDAEALSREL